MISDLNFQGDYYAMHGPKSVSLGCSFKLISFIFFVFPVAPVTVNIVNKVDQLVVGRESEIVCRSTGSRPPAHITWYLGGQRLEGGGTKSVRFVRAIHKTRAQLRREGVKARPPIEFLNAMLVWQIH